MGKSESVIEGSVEANEMIMWSGTGNELNAVVASGVG
jgi:hypothetical protein